MRILSRLYAVIGWLITALGALHMIATWRLSASSPVFRLWFCGSGFAMVLVGAFNLLQRVYGHAAAGLRIVCRGANMVLLIFALVGGALTGSTIVQYIVIIGLIGGALILSFVSFTQQPTPEAAKNPE